jgi:hypothetical protein
VKAAKEEELSWQAAVPVATNSFFLWDLSKGVAIASGGFYLLVALACAVAGDMEPAAVLAKPIAMVAAGMWVFLWLVGLGFYPRGYPMEFRVGRRGVAWRQASRLAQGAQWASLGAGLVSGRAWLAGGALIAWSQNAGEIRWREVRGVHFHRGRRVICVRDGWHVVVRLYCGAEEFGRIEEGFSVFWRRSHK